MIALLLAPFFLALQTYVVISASRSINKTDIKGKEIFKYVFALFMYSGILFIAVGFLLPGYVPAKRAFMLYGNNWLGFILYFYIAYAACAIVHLILKRTKKDSKCFVYASVIFIMLFTLSMGIYGLHKENTIEVKNYVVKIDKDSKLDELKIAMVSDLHIGYNVSTTKIQRIVDGINELEPDVVLIAGDIFDNEFEAVDDPEMMAQILKGIDSRYGTYAVLGNHDIEEKILVGFTFNWFKKDHVVKASDGMLEMLEKADIRLLYDDFITIEDIQIYGRPDYERPNLGNTERLSCQEFMAKVDAEKPMIVVDHEPRELEECSKCGIDLHLSGHTHNGQLWPGTISINWIWDNPYGMKRYGDMTSIVTSGVGVFGPNMRTDSICEIVDIKVDFR